MSLPDALIQNVSISGKYKVALIKFPSLRVMPLKGKGRDISVFKNYSIKSFVQHYKFKCYTIKKK